MIRPSALVVCTVLSLLGAGCRKETPYHWSLPAGYPAPPVPADNPLTVEKVELGRHLFYDTRLSENLSQSCASCHQQALAFSDGRTTALGSTGEHHFRNSQGLSNVAYASTLTWASPDLTRLERQALLPMFGERPVEMGMAGRERDLFQRLGKEPRYKALFRDAFPSAPDTIDLAHITQALASFVRTLVSYRSPYDRYVYEKDKAALDASAIRGMELFFSERLECFHCHNGFNFSDATVHAGSRVTAEAYHNTGLYNLDATGAYPEADRGLIALTHLPGDAGRFRAPSLRNVELTAPYMHDGSIATLDSVIDHYAEGGRTIASGPYAGDGSKNPHKSGFVRGFLLETSERVDLLSFLRSLTDRALTQDRRFSNPWKH